MKRTEIEEPPNADFEAEEVGLAREDRFPVDTRKKKTNKPEIREFLMNQKRTQEQTNEEKFVPYQRESFSCFCCECKVGSTKF